LVLKPNRTILEAGNINTLSTHTLPPDLVETFLISVCVYGV